MASQLKVWRHPAAGSVEQLYARVMMAMSLGCWLGGVTLTFAMAPLVRHNQWWMAGTLGSALLGVVAAGVLLTTADAALKASKRELRKFLEGKGCTWSNHEQI